MCVRFVNFCQIASSGRIKSCMRHGFHRKSMASFTKILLQFHKLFLRGLFKSPVTTSQDFLARFSITLLQFHKIFLAGFSIVINLVVISDFFNAFFTAFFPIFGIFCTIGSWYFRWGFSWFRWRFFVIWIVSVCFAFFRWRLVAIAFSLKRRKEI